MSSDSSYDMLSRLHRELLELLRRFHSMAIDHNVSYGLDHGTLLGAVRERGIISHDDDVDIYILEDDHDRIPALCGRYGLRSQEQLPEERWAGHKIWGVEYGDEQDMRHTPIIDVFTRIPEGGRYVNKGRYEHKFMTKSEVSSRTVYKLDGLYLYGPGGVADAGGFLDRVFGKNWRKPKKTHVHVDYLRPERLRTRDLGSSFHRNQRSMSAEFLANDQGPVVRMGTDGDKWIMAAIALGIVTLVIAMYVGSR